KEPYIEDQIRILWYTVFKSKGHYSNIKITEALPLYKDLFQLNFQLSGKQLTCIQYISSPHFQEHDLFAFFRDPRIYSPAAAQWVLPPRLLIPLDQYIVIGVQEKYFILYLLSVHLIKDFFQSGKILASPHIDPQS